MKVRYFFQFDEQKLCSFPKKVHLRPMKKKKKKGEKMPMKITLHPVLIRAKFLQCYGIGTFPQSLELP